MKLILTQDIPKIGAVGNIVQVKDGYARNYLIPNSLAIVANTGNMKELEHHKRILNKRKEKVLSTFKSVAAKINKLTLTIEKQVGEENKIFGSVTTAEIEALLEKEGIKVARKQITLPEAIKTTGNYRANIRLHAEVEASVKLKIVGP
jgi:large subunit ribosomal protein L9